MAIRPVSFCTLTMRSESASESAIGNLDLHVLAGAHALLGLVGVHLRGRGQNHGFDAGLFQAFAPDRSSNAGYSEFLGHFFGRQRDCRPTSDTHFDAVDLCDRLQMFDAECTGTRQDDFHG